MPDRLPLLQRLPRRVLTAFEVAVAVGYAATGWLLFGHKIEPWPAALVGLGLVAVTLALIRRYPVAGFVAGLAACWLAAAMPTLAFVALLPLGYALGMIAARFPLRLSISFAALAVTGPLASLVIGQGRGGVVPFTVVLLAAYTAGYLLGEQRRYADGRAEAAMERARRQLIEQRLGIARELHDIVAHSMSVVSLQAGYGQVSLDSDPERARAAFATIQVAGHQALEEMRRLLGLLRADAERTPTPRLTDLPVLIAATGVDVVLSVQGTPRALPASVELSAYRIVQEALSNVLRHSMARAAHATLTYHCDEVTVEVIDHGPGSPPHPGGFGLAGMRERTHLFGGHLSAGPLPDGGYRIFARLPVPSGAAA